MDALNSLVTECLDRYAPLKKVKATRLPAPWMVSDEIRELLGTSKGLKPVAVALIRHGLLPDDQGQYIALFSL